MHKVDAFSLSSLPTSPLLINVRASRSVWGLGSFNHALQMHTTSPLHASHRYATPSARVKSFSSATRTSTRLYLMQNLNATESVSSASLPSSSTLLQSSAASAIVEPEAVVVGGGGDQSSTEQNRPRKLHRFERTADTTAHLDEPCILIMQGKRYNLTAWAKAHPGGDKVLKKFHNKDATRAFEAAHHSVQAYEMLKDFEIDNDEQVGQATGAALLSDGLQVGSVAYGQNASTASSVSGVSDAYITSISMPLSNPESSISTWTASRPTARWRAKLFTSEDPYAIHKVLGVYCLLHFVFRHAQMLFGDPAAGLGSSRSSFLSGRIALWCLIPHALLSMSSLIFHTVPRDRVVGKPMIWQEFRVHNIVFGLRSVITAALTSWSIQSGSTPGVRRIGTYNDVVGKVYTVWLSSLHCTILHSMRDR
jgi:cytochrome b involved in lipid metabolism